MKNELDALLREAEASFAEAKSEQQINILKAGYLGKKSRIQEIEKTLIKLELDKRKELGILINRFKAQINLFVKDNSKRINDALVLEKIASESIDVTLPGEKVPVGHMHPLDLVVSLIEEVFLNMGYEIKEGSEIESDLYNFEMLNLPKGHPAREMQDSFYISATDLLRTHTSAVQAHVLLEEKGKPFKIICLGKVYRRDNDDMTHSHQFMQCEGLVVSEKAKMTDLKGTLAYLAKKLFGDELKIRFSSDYFPFTEPSVEVDVECFKCHGKGCPLCKNTGWIEILGAGMVHPNVLKMAGYDTNKYQGFAFGVGIERIAMLRYGIDDIRNFYTNDIRFLRQF